MRNVRDGNARSAMDATTRGGMMRTKLFSWILFLLLAVGLSLLPLILTTQPALADDWLQLNEDGFVNKNNDMASSMAVFNSKLYAGTYNSLTGCQVWRYDATDWTRVNTNGFGTKKNESVSSMVVFDSKLYAGTVNPTNGCQVWRYNSGTSWTKVNTNGFGDGDNCGISSMAVFNSKLYAGTFKPSDGCQVWRYNSGTSWTKVNTNGFGDVDNIDSSSLAVFNSKLYAGTMNIDDDGDRGCRVFRYDGGTSWTKVNTDGFGNANNRVAMRMAVYKSKLYAGTANYTNGCQVWRYNSGTSWTKVNTNGFGTSKNQQIMSMSVIGSNLYVGTLNGNGCQVWRYTGDSWARASSAGLGDSWNVAAASMAVNDSQFYIGTYNQETGCEVLLNDTVILPTPTLYSPGSSVDGKAILWGAVHASGVTVNIYSGGKVVAQTTTNAYGNYRVQLSGLSEGDHDFHVEAVERELTSDTSETARVTVRPNIVPIKSIECRILGSNRRETLSTENTRSDVNAIQALNCNLTTMNVIDIWVRFSRVPYYCGSGDEDDTYPKIGEAWMSSYPIIVTPLGDVTLPGGLLKWTGDIDFIETESTEGEEEAVLHTRVTDLDRLMPDDAEDGEWYKVRIDVDYEMELMPGYSGTVSSCVLNLRCQKNPPLLVDPSGNIYDETTERRIPGAKVTLEKKGSGGSFSSWPAGEFDQANSLYTDAMGWYGWDVPTGDYRIVVEKDSYRKETSRVVTVPPEVTDLHVGLQRDGPCSYYFAEGCTRSGFEEWLCLQNPGEEEVSATITYMLGTGENRDQPVTVPGKSRVTVSVNDFVGPEQDVSAKVTSDSLLIAERPMYFNYKGMWAGGHSASGTSSPMSNWYFAEGYTGPGFEEWLCIQNPSDTEANVEITYMLGTGENKTVEHTVGAMSRATVDVNTDVGPDQEVSASVTCTNDVPIIVERPMYFNYRDKWPGGHIVMGAETPRQSWYFAEGCTGAGFEEWICIQNPSETEANVEITYMLGTGENKTTEHTVGAKSRSTVSVNSEGEVGPNQDVSCVITSDVPVIAERPMYFNYRDKWPGGHAVVGTMYAKDIYFLAEGCTREGFEEWICLQNPGNTDVDVEITYMLGTGENKTQEVTVPANSRQTVDVGLAVGPGQDVSTMLTTSGGSIICERPQYFNYRGTWAGGHDMVGF